jgi:hypothetical protein
MVKKASLKALPNKEMETIRIISEIRGMSGKRLRAAQNKDKRVN